MLYLLEMARWAKRKFYAKTCELGICQFEVARAKEKVTAKNDAMIQVKNLASQTKDNISSIFQSGCALSTMGQVTNPQNPQDLQAAQARSMQINAGAQAVSSILDSTMNQIFIKQAENDLKRANEHAARLECRAKNLETECTMYKEMAKSNFDAAQQEASNMFRRG